MGRDGQNTQLIICRSPAWEEKFGFLLGEFCCKLSSVPHSPSNSVFAYKDSHFWSLEYSVDPPLKVKPASTLVMQDYYFMSHSAVTISAFIAQIKHTYYITFSNECFFSFHFFWKGINCDSLKLNCRGPLINLMEILTVWELLLNIIVKKPNAKSRWRWLQVTSVK